MKLTDMRRVLAARGIRLTKSLGQNFLHDANQLRRIVAAAELTRADRVLEIGPGRGPLTERLRARAGEVLAIEKDAQLARFLQERWPPGSPAAGALRILTDDALEFLRREPRDWRQWKLVANLPYSVASPILVELAGDRGPQRLVATLQLEVARRLMAQPGSPDYGVLTLLVQLNCQPQTWFRIPAACFFPEPDVDSACVCLVRRPRPLLPPESRDAFVRIVKRAFSQRRKMMFKLLKADWPQPRLAALFRQLDLSPQVRAETVSLEQFAHLAAGLHPGAPAPATAAQRGVLR